MTNFAQHVVFRYTHVIKEKFGWRPATHRGNGSRFPAHLSGLPGSRSRRHFVGVCAVSDGKNHREIGLVAAGDENLLPVDHPIAAIFDSGSANRRGVRARTWFGEGETRMACALDGRE